MGPPHLDDVQAVHVGSPVRRRSACPPLRRSDLPDDEVADIVWSMNAEYRALLVGERGWPAERFGAWPADAWTRLLLT